MRRGILWLVLLAIAIVMDVYGNSALAQQPTDPAPVEEAPDLASDLPLPEHSLMVEQAVRDNSRAFFGVTFDPSVPNAALARSVIAGSPADLAGVKAGDTIVALNGQDVETYDDVLSTIARLKPGDVLDVEISRRVSVRARAVLDGQPVGVEHTTSYRAEAEALPSPAEFGNEPPITRAPINRRPANVDLPRPRPNDAAPQNRNPNVNRDGNSNRGRNPNDRNRENRGRGGFLRRR
jgi:membrane-associated protease RseP (regulator of RpoE activity)